MFPSNIEFFGREKHQERFQDMEQIRLVRLAKLQRLGDWAMLQKVKHQLGRWLVQWGLRLQGYKLNTIQQMENNLQVNNF